MTRIYNAGAAWPHRRCHLEADVNKSEHRAASSSCGQFTVRYPRYDKDLKSVVHSDPKMLGGAPVFVGTRLPLETLLQLLNAGESIEKFLEDYTSAKRSQVLAVIEILGLKMDSGKVRRTARLKSLLKRHISAVVAGELQELVLDARIEDGVLCVISPSFDRLEVPLAKIPAFRNKDASKIQAFKIDEDGSFNFWPKLNVHLGWIQLLQLVDPNAAIEASQRASEFNRCYGIAVKRVREQAGLKPPASAVSGW